MWRSHDHKVLDVLRLAMIRLTPQKALHPIKMFPNWRLDNHPGLCQTSGE
jgi:hypothetical protein